MPDTDDVTWQGFLQALGPAIASAKGTKSIAENAWQMPLDVGLPVLLQMSQQATRSGVRLAVHISDEPLDWTHLPPLS